MFGFVKSIFGKSDPKILTSADLDRLLMSGGLSSGAYVNETSAMGIAAYYTCVKILSESLAQLPLDLGKKDASGIKTTDRNSDLFNLLHYQPNMIHNSFEFRELMMVMCLNRGDAVAIVTRRANGEAIEMLPAINPKITLGNGWNIKYEVKVGDAYEVIPRENILHIRGMSLNGYSGMSPIAFQRETLGHSIALQKHGSTLFSNGARPSGVLSHPNKLSKEATERIRDSWYSAHGGENQGGTAVIEEGITYTPISLTNQDSQYIEAKQLSKTDIFSIFRIPPHMAADLSKSSFNNIEQQSLEFLKYALLPWIKRWEHALRRDVLTREQKKSGYFADFNLVALERSDIKTRYESYMKGIQNGIMSPNEARALEGLNPREGGDVYLTPMNMTTNPESGKEQ